jgi:hypothetical protein
VRHSTTTTHLAVLACGPSVRDYANHFDAREGRVVLRLTAIAKKHGASSVSDNTHSMTSM